MAGVAEFELGAQIEEVIAANILGDEQGVSLYGLAVTVNRMNPAAAGIAKTAQPRGHPVLETNLRYLKPKGQGKGAVFAIDPEHNALWLRPQRLTSTAINAGFLVVAGFVQDELPAYTVTVREPGWRDGEPFRGLPPGRFQKYVEGDMPDLLPQAWATLGLEVKANPSDM